MNPRRQFTIERRRWLTDEAVFRDLETTVKPYCPRPIHWKTSLSAEAI